MTKPDQRVALWGGYGFGNAGDELLLAAALEAERANSSAPPIVLSREPEVCAWSHATCEPCPYEPAGTRLIRRLMRRRAAGMPAHRLADQPVDAPWRRALARCTRLRLTGGGYFTDLFQLDWFLLPLEEALARGLEVEVGPIGFGPFREPAAERRAADLLRRCARVTVRDDISREQLASLGITAEWQRDEGFAVRGLPGFGGIGPRPTRAAGDPLRIGILVSPQHGAPRREERLAWIASMLGALRARLGDDAIFEGFCFQCAWWEDFSELVRLFDRLGWDRRAVRPATVDWRETLLQVRRYDLVLSTRFHPSVVAHAFDVPCAVLLAGPYYERKMVGAFRDLQTKTARLEPLSEDPVAAAERAAAMIDA